MPIKWTSENDQLLLLKILETCAVNADVRKISEAWHLVLTSNLARDQGDVPTARAITERLCKIRTLAKANGCGHFSVASSQNKEKSTTPNSTPRKPRARKETAVVVDESEQVNGSGGKRKRNVTVKTENLNREETERKGDVMASDGALYSCDEESPTKKWRGLSMETMAMTGEMNGVEGKDDRVYNHTVIEEDPFSEEVV
ncbi:hypothetical protein MMC19_001785 [Ptychographa xylographoides]|nr:hypothetical protein [Ptychographa xylographoides]